MNKYTVKDVTKMLGVSNHTLRYYDKLGLCKPHRMANNYRYYTDADLQTLKYIIVLKYGGLSLEEIKVILSNKQSLKHSDANLASTLKIISDHKHQLTLKIVHYQQLLEIIGNAEQVLTNNPCQDKTASLELVQQIFSKIIEEQTK